MRVFWWNGGLHIEPETERERDVLVTLAESSLKLAQFDHEITAGPIAAVAIHDEQSVGPVHVLPQ